MSAKIKSPEEILKEERDKVSPRYGSAVTQEEALAAITKYHQQFKLSDGEILEAGQAESESITTFHPNYNEEFRRKVKKECADDFICGAKWAQSKIFPE